MQGVRWKALSKRGVDSSICPPVRAELILATARLLSLDDLFNGSQCQMVGTIRTKSSGEGRSLQTVASQVSMTASSIWGKMLSNVFDSPLEHSHGIHLVLVAAGLLGSSSWHNTVIVLTRAFDQNTYLVYKNFSKDTLRSL